MSDVNSKKIHIILYTVALISFFSYYTFSELVTNFFVVSLLKSVSYYSCAFFSVSSNIFATKRNKLWFLFFIVAIPLTVYFYAAYGYFYIFHVLLVTASCGISKDFIIRTCYKTLLVLLCFCVFLLLFGFVQDSVSYRMVYGISVANHTMGFRHYSGFAFRFMALSYLFLYLCRNRLTVTKIALIVFFNIVIGELTCTRLHLLVVASFLMMVLLAYKYDFLKFESKKWMFFALLSYPVALVVFALIGLNLLGNDAFYAWWDEQASGRMLYTMIAYSTYGVSLLGNKIKMVGAAEHELTGEDVFYIDAGYAYWPLALGAFFSVLLLLCYTCLFYRAYKRRDRFVYIWLLIFLFANFVNDFFHFSIANPVLFLLFCDYENKQRCRIVWKNKLIG